MKKNRIRKIFLFLSLIAVLMVEIGKASGSWLTCYHSRIYPVLLSIVTPVTSFIPVSIYDLFIFLSILFLLYLVFNLFRKGRRLKSLTSIVIFVCLVYSLFYVEWGFNYFAPGFYSSNGIKYEKFDSLRFDSFLKQYAENLNESYVDSMSLDDKEMWRIVADRYSEIREEFNLCELPKGYRSKWMIFSDVYAMMGVKGYYGPFFFETHLNRNLLKDELPATAAHETAHLLGITGEAEANFYSYVITTESDNSDARFSGYFSILPYVLSNASGVLSENDFKSFVSLLSEEVRIKYRKKIEHWSNLYSPLVGDVQEWIYNLYLKGNNIPTGTANYSQVVGMIISYQDFLKAKAVNSRISEMKQQYPLSTLRDVYKSFFQEKYGPGHLMGHKAKNYLLSEIEEMAKEKEDGFKVKNGYYENTGLYGDYVRVDLHSITDSIIPFEDFWNYFSSSMDDVCMPDINAWRNEWKFIVDIVSERKSEFDGFEVDSVGIDNNLKNDVFVGHHSPVYEDAYKPHYRIINRKNFEAMREKYFME